MGEKANDFNDMLVQKIVPKEQIQKENTQKSKTIEDIFNEWKGIAYKDNSTYGLLNRLDYHIISKYKTKSIRYKSSLWFFQKTKS